MLVVTEAMVFLALVSAYFFVRAVSPDWPQGGIDPPDVVRAGIFSVLLLGSSIPMVWAEHAAHRDRQTQLRAALAIAFVMAAVFLGNQVDEFRNLEFSLVRQRLRVAVRGHHRPARPPRARCARDELDGPGQGVDGRIGPGRDLTLRVFGIYWHFVDGVWVVVFSSLYVAAHLARPGEMAAGLLSAPTGGLRRWYAVLAGIGLWMVHIVALAALATSSCHSTASLWSMHLITLVTAVGTVVAMIWSWAMVRDAGPVDDGCARGEGTRAVPRVVRACHRRHLPGADPVGGQLRAAHRRMPARCDAGSEAALMTEVVSDLVLVLIAAWYLAGVRVWWFRIGPGAVVRRWEAACFVGRLPRHRGGHRRTDRRRRRPVPGRSHGAARAAAGGRRAAARARRGDPGDGRGASAGVAPTGAAGLGAGAPPPERHLVAGGRGRGPCWSTWW